MLFPVTCARIEALFRDLKVEKTHNMFGCYGPGSPKSRWELQNSEGTTVGTFIRWYPFGQIEFYSDVVNGQIDPSAEILGKRYASVVREPFRP